MSAGIYSLKNFGKIVRLDVEVINYAEGEHASENQGRIGRVVSLVIDHLQNTSNPEDAESVSLFIEKIKLLDKQFEEAGRGTVFAASIHALSLIQQLRANLAPSRQDVVKDPFILELKALAEAPEIEDKIAAARKLHKFQKDVLLPALRSAQTRDELLALEPLVEYCNALKDKVASVDQKGALEELKMSMLALWNVKWLKNDRFYSFLINYQTGQCGDLKNKERREQVAPKLEVFMSQLIEAANHPEMTREDKAALYKGLCAIYKEFSPHGDLIEPALRELCKALDLPFPESKKAAAAARSAAFSQLQSRFCQSALPEAIPSAKMAPVRAKALQSPEKIRDAAIARIRENIARLDLGSPRLREDVQKIQADIDKLRGLDLMQGTDFSGLEEALNVIVDSRSLGISAEESLFVERLLVKYSKSSDDLPRYADAQAASVHNARSSLLKVLKKSSVISLENLVQKAPVAKEAARDQAIKERFDRFVEIHPFPGLTHHFAAFFPVLVRNFEAFTKEVIVRELEQKWQEIQKVYDSRSKGKFSKLLEYYSYMNPRKQFSEFIEESQIEFFNKLDLAAIDRTSKDHLVSYLEQIVSSVKDYPGSLFASEYMSMYSDEHVWLLNNVNAIKVPFNQADDIHENLGNGVCYQNSLYRFTILQDEPRIPSDRVKMGSSSRSRFLGSKIGSYYAAAKAGAIAQEAASDELTKISEEYGLQQYHQYTLATPPSTDPHEYLTSEMERFARAGHTQFIVALYGSDEGHAVNVQLDFANGMYRLFDDNIGLCEYRTFEEFKAEVSQYFKYYYSDYDVYQFRLFQSRFLN